MIRKYPDLQGEARGRGLMKGIAVNPAEIAGEICNEAFKLGLIVETSGPNSEVVKFLPPLIIDEEGLNKGFALLDEAIEKTLNK